DPARAQRFYAGLFRWELTAWAPPRQYWLVRTGSDGPGIDGGLVPRRGPPPDEGLGVNAFVCTSAVSNVDETVAAAPRLGANVAVPKMAIPTVGWLALKDTEGNLLGVMANDPAAR
ncbi:MAG: VOC family protein, partial [Myxococcales bacterium]